MTVTVKNPACADAINHRPPERHDGQIKESHDKPPLRQTPHPRDVPLSNSGGNRQAQTFFHLRGWEIKSDGMIGWATYSSLTPILTILRPQYLPDPNTYNTYTRRLRAARTSPWILEARRVARPPMALAACTACPRPSASVSAGIVTAPRHATAMTASISSLPITTWTSIPWAFPGRRVQVLIRFIPANKRGREAPFVWSLADALQCGNTIRRYLEEAPWDWHNADC
jgi:hypothetical protein